MIRKFLRGQKGAVAIEYAIVGGMISIAIIVGVTNLGENTEELYEDVDTTISQAKE